MPLYGFSMDLMIVEANELVSDSLLPSRESLHLFPAFILFSPGVHRTTPLGMG